jgi:hypothetical protein
MKVPQRIAPTPADAWAKGRGAADGPGFRWGGCEKTDSRNLERLP